MFGFPTDTWVLLVLSVAPGMALAVWNARRVRRALSARGKSAPPSGR